MVSLRKDCLTQTLSSSKYIKRITQLDNYQKYFSKQKDVKTSIQLK